MDIFSKLKPARVAHPIQDTVFGDMSFTRWMMLASRGALALEPWASFARAKQQIDSGKARDAVSILQDILAMPQIESRCYLQAYPFLRELGVQCAEKKAKDVLGVVVEIGMKDGADMIAAYSDYGARYYNCTGASVVSETAAPALNAPIADILRAGQTATRMISVWKGKRLPAPIHGQARISILTPSGLHFGESPYEALARNRIGGSILTCASRLAQELTNNDHGIVPKHAISSAGTA